MKLQFYTPRNSVLKKYIEGYYFIADDRVGEIIKYLTFPNNYCIVSANIHSNVILGENRITIEPVAAENIHVDLAYRYIKPIEVYGKSPISEITIYFKPLGLNHFVTNLETYFRQKCIMTFYPFADLKETMGEIFKLPDRDLQIETLESYWLSKLSVRDLHQMEEILKDVESSLKIEAIANKHNISRQYLNKIFLKNFGKSASEYRKIHRFRDAIARKKNVKSLTELSYDNMFYDQSHFIKTFRELTHNSPNAFFRQVNTNDKNIWLFL